MNEKAFQGQEGNGSFINIDTKWGDYTARFEHKPNTPPAFQADRQKRIPVAKDIAKENQIKRWLETGVILKWNRDEMGQPGKYNMRLVTVEQAMKTRVCVDARALNKDLISDDYPIPDINELLTSCAGNTYFSEFDLTSAFNRFPVFKGHRHKLAFSWKDFQPFWIVVRN